MERHERFNPPANDNFVSENVPEDIFEFDRDAVSYLASLGISPDSILRNEIIAEALRKGLLSSEVEKISDKDRRLLQNISILQTELDKRPSYRHKPTIDKLVSLIRESIES